MKINLGSGKDLIPGWVNVDWRAPADVVCDLNACPYPFENESADEIRVWNVLEHLDDPSRALGEVHRILARGGVAHIRVPHFTSIAVAANPTHRRGFAVRTFQFFTAAAEYPLVPYAFARYRANIGFLKTYRLQRVLNAFASWYANRWPDKYETTGLCYLFPAWGIDVWLEK